MDGAAAEAVRGLKAEKDTDLALIWEALSHRFGFVDEPERAMRRFDVRKQLEGETLAVFEQSLRMLHREAWSKTDIKSPEADSLLHRKFVDGILDIELQKYLRLHAVSDDFATTVSKARQFVDAKELSRTAKKPALCTTSPNVNYQTIIDGVMEALEQRDRGRMAGINTIQTSGSSATAGNRNKKALPRQGSPAPSNSSAGSSSSRASSTSRTVRFQDEVDAGASNRGYESPARSRWRDNRSPQGNSSGSRPWMDHRPPGQETPRSPSPRWSPRQGGPRAPSPQTGNQCASGQGGSRFRPPAQGNAGNFSPGWRSSSGDRSGQPPGQQRWSRGSTSSPRMPYLRAIWLLYIFP